MLKIIEWALLNTTIMYLFFRYSIIHFIK